MCFSISNIPGVEHGGDAEEIAQEAELSQEELADENTGCTGLVPLKRVFLFGKQLKSLPKYSPDIKKWGGLGSLKEKHDSDSSGNEREAKRHEFE
jgi:hypothetical protein